MKNKKRRGKKKKKKASTSEGHTIKRAHKGYKSEKERQKDKKMKQYDGKDRKGLVPGDNPEDQIPKNVLNKEEQKRR